MSGNKIGNLQLLKESGFNVPEFRKIPFSAVVDREKYKSLLGKNKDINAEEYRKIIDASWREDFDIQKFLDFEKDISMFSVRSSCNVEDGEELSFAGQFDTFLNVGTKDLGNKVSEVIRSLANPGLIDYARNSAATLSDIGMDVIVQEMVLPRLSGVIFSSNPQGILNEAVITVGEGTGDGVVGDLTDTSSYYCNRTDDEYYYEGDTDFLTAKEISALLELTDRIKAVTGEFIDIEFAIKGDEIFVLQVRNITTLKGETPLILDNSNIVESYPGLSLPLTISFVKLVYGGVFRGVSRRVLKNDKELLKHSDIFENMVGSANGRIYYKISNWYTMLKFLPFSSRIIPVWQEMLGVGNKTYDKEDVNLSLPVRVGTYFNSLYELIRVPKGMKELDDEFSKVNAEFYEKYSDELSPKELIEIFDDIRKKLFDIWDVTLLNDMYAFIFTGLLKARIRKKGGDEKTVNEYISGISDIESMKPVSTLIDIALNKDGYTDFQYEEVKRDYISKYGDRNLEELKLESRTFRTDPQLFDDQIETIRNSENKDKLSGYMHKPAPLGREGGITRFLSKRAAMGIAAREKSRLNRCRAYGIVRQIMLSIGSSYERQGLIDEQRDIFMLTLDEVFDMAEHPVRMTDEIAKRKEQYRMYDNLPAYSRLIFENSEFDKNHRSVNHYVKKESRNELTGVPCSGGIARGEALVINGPRDKASVEGKILVTRMTDPGWVFMLTTAKGLVSEKGSLLSHTSIISRELGIPSVVGVKGLLENVESGDIISMDGNTGVIRIERKS